MYPYFRELVTSTQEHSLEISALPFYCVGGAGTHYPAKDKVGDPFYLPNMRLPRRILGLLPVAGMEGETSSDPQLHKHLEICGFGGQWFDCRDVEGFLRERGVDVDGSALFPAVHSLPLNYAPSASGHDLPNIERNEPPGFNWTSTNPTVLDTPPVSMEDGDTPLCVPEIGKWITVLWNNVRWQRLTIDRPSSLFFDSRVITLHT